MGSQSELNHNASGSFQFYKPCALSLHSLHLTPASSEDQDCDDISQPRLGLNNGRVHYAMHPIVRQDMVVVILAVGGLEDGTSALT